MPPYYNFFETKKKRIRIRSKKSLLKRIKKLPYYTLKLPNNGLLVGRSKDLIDSEDVIKLIEALDE